MFGSSRYFKDEDRFNDICDEAYPGCEEDCKSQECVLKKLEQEDKEEFLKFTGFIID